MSICLCFIDIFPVFDVFFPDFPSACQSWFLFTQLHAKPWKIFGASVETFFVQFHIKHWKNFGDSCHLQGAIKIFACVGMKKQGRNYHAQVLGKISTLVSFWSIFLFTLDYLLFCLSLRCGNLFLFTTNLSLFYLDFRVAKIRNIYLSRSP